MARRTISVRSSSSKSAPKMPKIKTAKAPQARIKVSKRKPY